MEKSINLWKVEKKPISCFVSICGVRTFLIYFFMVSFIVLCLFLTGKWYKKIKKKKKKKKKNIYNIWGLCKTGSKSHKSISFFLTP